jgi:cellulose synthase/poly-beta-1,6-N-acetylglucosamine synthase-like glycosyltransferase
MSSIVIGCIVGLAYIYLGYPLIIWMLAKAFPRPIRKDAASMGLQCSVVISAYHEGSALLRKVDSILESTAVDSVREIVIGLDGAPDTSDSTPAELAALQERRHGHGPDVRVHLFPERRGKAAVLNDLVPLTCGDILIMMDARQTVHPAAIGKLLANFADESIGVVSGELVFETSSRFKNRKIQAFSQGRAKPPAEPWSFQSAPGEVMHENGSVQQGVGFYWEYEKFIRRCEARFRSVPGATGALYAIRRRLFKPIPAGTLLDDVAIPMQAVAQGGRCVFEPAAVVYDVTSSTAGQESLRKRRTIAGVAQLMGFYPEWLLPWRNPIWFEYISHKVLRLTSPILLLVLFACNLMLLDRPVFIVLMALQFAFYVLALAGMAAQRLGKRAGCLGIPMMFVALNITTALALWDALCGRYNAAWKK